ncbi:MAG: hypothetical protein MJE63_24190 [Proteobacteria bacterium]|nr:hypothetical protein [Pseudomonadota bacterium]
MSVKKTVILDSSSAILLEKSELLNELLNAYHVVLTEAVYNELTMNSYLSASLFKTMFEESLIEVQPLSTDIDPERKVILDLAAMDIGEADTITYYLSGHGDFIMLDDKQGARFCLKQQIPFINALLFPKILYFAELLSREEYLHKTETIRQLGRYSDSIINKARKLTKPELNQFLPSN